MLVPVAFKNYHAGKNEVVLAGDLGGTKINVALFQPGEDGFSEIRQHSFHSKDYSSLTAVIKQFMGDDKVPATISIAVAGPVIDGRVKITNLPWELDSHEINQELNTTVFFINDLEANAYGLAALKQDELYTLCEANEDLSGNLAILAPGTGLGEAGLYWDGKNYHPFATEGGHSPFAVQNELDFALYNWLRKQFNFVSSEHVVSGMGIHNIFRFLTEEMNNAIPAWLDAELKTEDPSAVISENAIAKKSGVCVETMDLFVRYLATESSSLVLKYKATGGLFLSGGIPPKILPLLQKDRWQRLFFESDRMEKLLQQTPVHIILNQKTPLLGAAYYGAYNT
jgi:glucokinase